MSFNLYFAPVLFSALLFFQALTYFNDGQLATGCLLLSGIALIGAITRITQLQIKIVYLEADLAKAKLSVDQ